MTLSLPRSLALFAGRSLHRHSCRFVNIDVPDIKESDEDAKQNYGYAPETIDIISHSKLDFINKRQRKKIDKMEDEISIHLESGFQVYEHDSVPIWNPSTLFQVGHRDQFNQFAADNIFKLFDTFMYPVSTWNQWTISKAMKNDLNLRNTSSIIDYHPFHYTFPGQKSIPSNTTNSNSSKSKSMKKWKIKDWKRVTNDSNHSMHSKFEDSFGSNMPLLTRDDQELLIWRDEHNAISNMHKIHKLLNEYNPDIIVLEGYCDESTMRIYGKSSYKMYLETVRKVLSRMVPQSPSRRATQESMGTVVHRIADALFVRQGEMQSGAFVNHGIIQWMMQNADNISDRKKQPLLVFGDLNLDICGVFMVIARYLDTYQLPMVMELLSELDGGIENVTFKNAKNEVNFEEIYGKLLMMEGGREGLLMDMLCEFLSPHRTVVANYRNHFLSLAINEAALAHGETIEEGKCKILAVMGEGHVNDVIYKLEHLSKGAVVNPYKDITDRQVILKPNVSITSRGYSGRTLTEKEQDFVATHFGDNLLNVFVNKIEQLK